jgi:hypothetical protein
VPAIQIRSYVAPRNYRRSRLLVGLVGPVSTEARRSALYRVPRKIRAVVNGVNAVDRTAADAVFVPLFFLVELAAARLPSLPNAILASLHYWITASCHSATQSERIEVGTRS